MPVNTPEIEIFGTRNLQQTQAMRGQLVANNFVVGQLGADIAVEADK